MNAKRPFVSVSFAETYYPLPCTRGFIQDSLHGCTPWGLFALDVKGMFLSVIIASSSWRPDRRSVGSCRRVSELAISNPEPKTSCSKTLPKPKGQSVALESFACLSPATGLMNVAMI
jgi:hypothetical protein